MDDLLLPDAPELIHSVDLGKPGTALVLAPSAEAMAALAAAMDFAD